MESKERNAGKSRDLDFLERRTFFKWIALGGVSVTAVLSGLPRNIFGRNLQQQEVDEIAESLAGNVEPDDCLIHYTCGDLHCASGYCPSGFGGCQSGYVCEQGYSCENYCPSGFCEQGFCVDNYTCWVYYRP